MNDELKIKKNHFILKNKIENLRINYIVEKKIHF
jgi:hypothetical protein